METQTELKRPTNIQNEMCFVGSLYKQPDLYVSYGNFMRSQYDFSDECTKFFYDMFELMYTTFSQTFDETQINIFMSLYITEHHQNKCFLKFFQTFSPSR